MTTNRNGPGLGSPGARTHYAGPDQDRAARLAVCHLLGERQSGPDEIYEVLAALALLPGDESKRRALGTDLTELSKDPRCSPKMPRHLFVPS